MAYWTAIPGGFPERDSGHDQASDCCEFDEQFDIPSVHGEVYGPTVATGHASKARRVDGQSLTTEDLSHHISPMEAKSPGLELPSASLTQTTERSTASDDGLVGQHNRTEYRRSSSCPPMQSSVLASPRNHEAAQSVVSTSMPFGVPRTRTALEACSSSVHAGSKADPSTSFIDCDNGRPRSRSFIETRTKPGTKSDFARYSVKAGTPSSHASQTTSVFARTESTVEKSTLPFDHPAHGWNLVSIPSNPARGGGSTLEPDVVIEYESSRLVVNTRDLVDASRTKQLLANISNVIDKARRDGTFGTHCRESGAVEPVKKNASAVADVGGSAQSKVPVAKCSNVDSVVAQVIQESVSLYAAAEPGTFHVTLNQGTALTVTCCCQSYGHCASSSEVLVTRIWVFFQSLLRRLARESDAPEEKPGLSKPSKMTMVKRKAFSDKDDGDMSEFGDDSSSDASGIHNKRGRTV